MTRRLSPILCVAAVVLLPAAARGQQSPPGPETVSSDRREYTNEQKNAHYIGHVTIERSDGNIYADDVLVYGDENRMVATGNVVFAQGNNRLSAERAEFDTKTGLGTFYNAWGIATVQPPPARGTVGVAPPLTGQDTHVYFFGDKIEKVGPKKYKITRGGFSTCVQPTPRWDLSAGTVVLNIDHYTLLKQAVFKVKGVPMMYLPVFYYPTTRDDRATGLLIPTYGNSTIRGHTVHNAFFWAINRSHDATVFHDWFSKTGQGYGSEYRYNLGAGDGNLRAHVLNEHEASYGLSDGTPVQLPARRSFELRGGANQTLPGNWRARASANYFSSIEAIRTYNTNIADASRNIRSYGGNVIGGWGAYTLNGTFDQNEYFYSQNSSVVSGNWPRVNFALNERPVIGSSLYVSVGAEYVHPLASTRTTTLGVTTETDSSRTRFDFAPQIRFPFKKWQWFTINSTASWRDTYYSKTYPVGPDGTVTSSTPVDVGLNRMMYTLQSSIVGPVFNRIWDTPTNGYAEKFKHTVEPFLNISRTSSVDDLNRIIVVDATDTFVGSMNATYGINNRFFAKRKLTPGALSQAAEFIGVEVSQTYYTNKLAAIYDRQFTSFFTGGAPSNFSPIALTVRAVPSTPVNLNVRAEFDSKYLELRTISAGGTYSVAGRLQTSAGWSKRAFIEQLPGFNDPRNLDHFLNASTNIHTQNNRVGGIYTFNFDVLRKSMMNQRITGFYNAQCCGIAFEYQSFNFGTSYSVPFDRRFFMSFTLAGLGNFSPFNGALGGVPR